MHQSVATIQSPEFINLQPLDMNPLMSKCEIKVLYVGQNRNHSFITKEVATDMAKTLRGAPIVGYYKDEKEDFRDHGDKVIIEDGELKFECQTKPYGFVSPDAKVWFKEFEDTDEFGNVETREYLMTTGYLWTGQYEEVQKVVEEGRPQSMELDGDTLDGHWAEDKNSGIDFFIINDAIFSKLCILGDDVEPCFEGSSVTAPQVSSSFTAVDDSFKNTLFSMLEELKFALKGGTEMSKVDEKTTDTQFAKDEEEKKNTSTDESKEVDTQGNPEEEKDTEEKKANEEKKEEEEKKEASTKHAKEDEEEKKEDENEEKKFASDDEEEEYTAKEDEEEKTEEEDEDKKAVEKSAKADDEKEEKSDDSEEKKDDEEDKEKKFALLEEEVSRLQKENEALLEFKHKVERKEKEALIEQFSVILAEEDLKDVKENIDKYSCSEIESKLSVTCVRKKVSFDSLKEDSTSTTGTEDDVVSYTITDGDVSSSTPAWVKSVRRTQEENK